jgi:DNA-binding response OmpR family regulator
VLIVDDQPDMVASMAMLVRAWGHQAETALNGRRAVEVARRFRPEIVFLDLGLPDIDGWQVARELRALPGQSARTRILAVSGKYSEEYRQRSLDAGCDEHLLKPLDPKLLEDLLQLY